MATAEVRPNIRHPHLLRNILLHLLYTLIGVLLIAPPAYMYGLIFTHAANFQDFSDGVEISPWEYFERPDYSNVEEGSTIYLYYHTFPAVPFGEFYDRAEPYTVVRNPAHIFADGTTVALVESPYRDPLVYLLPDGKVLMTEQRGGRIYSVENTPFELSDVDIPDGLQRDIINDCKLNFETWNDYFVLNRLYDDYLAGDYTPGYSDYESVAYHRKIDVTYVSDRYLFVEAHFGHGNEGYDSTRHNVVYDRVNGKRVKVSDLFCVGEQQAKERLVEELLRPREMSSEMFGPNEQLSDAAYAEVLAMLDLSSLRFYKKGVYFDIPVGALSDYPDWGISTSCSYASIADILVDCALPNKLKSWQLIDAEAFTLDDGRPVSVYRSDKGRGCYGLFVDGVWILSAPLDVTPGRPFFGVWMVDWRYKSGHPFNEFENALEVFESLPPSAQAAFRDYADAHYRDWVGDSIVAQVKYTAARHDATVRERAENEAILNHSYSSDPRGLRPLASINLGDLRVAMENDAVVVFEHTLLNYALREPDDPRDILPYELDLEKESHYIIVNKHTDSALDADIGGISEDVLKLFTSPDDLFAVALAHCEDAAEQLAVDSLREAVFSGDFIVNSDGVRVHYRRSRPADMNIDADYITMWLELDYNDVMPLLKPWARPAAG